jgi:hypothetical protein
VGALFRGLSHTLNMCAGVRSSHSQQILQQ